MFHPKNSSWISVLDLFISGRLHTQYEKKNLVENFFGTLACPKG